MSTQPISDSAYTTPLVDLAKEYTYRGMAILAPEQLGIPRSVHEELYRQEKTAYAAKEPINPQSIPALQELLSAPGLIAAIDALIGEDWAIVPYTHNAPFCSGAHDQQWHKDDNGPYNGRKMRHHQSVQMEMIYYPQDVTPEMGPTATIPYAHFWTFNNEENNDNFAGADHLDFDYLLSGMEGVPVSGPDSVYDEADIKNRMTAHDLRMRDNIKTLNWPLAMPFEAAPVKAGSVLLYSHNTFHRGNHRRDHWSTWQDNPRFMWRFYLYRTKDTTPQVPMHDVDWKNLGTDPLTGADLNQADANLTSIWRHQYQHLFTCRAAPLEQSACICSTAERVETAQQLYQQMLSKHDQGEPLRIGAAYQLAALNDQELALHYLEKALYVERENVRRAATYGLAAIGEAAIPLCLRAMQMPIKWVRRAAVFILGEVAPLRADIVAVLEKSLATDESVAIRSAAAGSLGCMARRAFAQNKHVESVPTVLAHFIESLGREENRPCMAGAQGRSIKMVRPTDDCDICEGNGVDLGHARFERVRSAVRENILWSMVMLCSHDPRTFGPQLTPCIEALKDIVANDKNPINVGFASDALNRLAHLNDFDDPRLHNLAAELHELLSALPQQCTESLIRVPAQQQC